MRPFVTATSRTRTSVSVDENIVAPDVRPVCRGAESAKISLVSRNKLHQSTYKPYSGALYTSKFVHCAALSVDLLQKWHPRFVCRWQSM